MLNRPLLLKLFIVYLILDPFIRTMIISIEKDFSIMMVISKTLSLSKVDIFNYWFLNPLSGILLWFVNLPMLFGYFILQVYSIYFHVNYDSYSWPYLSQTPALSAYVLLSINCLILIYLLLPSSIEIFKNKALRWWERASRFSIDEACKIEVGNMHLDAHIVDLSFSGASIIVDQVFKVSDEFTLLFKVANKDYTQNSTVVRFIKEVDGNYNYGIKFNTNTSSQKFKLKLLMVKIIIFNLYPKYR